MNNAQNLIASGDAITFQALTAVTQPVEETSRQPLGEMEEALVEAQTRGFVFDPYSLEDQTYGAAEIQDFIDGRDFGGVGPSPFEH